MNTRNIMASSYHSKVMPTQTWESHFSLVWFMEFSITSPCFGKDKTCSDSCNLTNVADIQR